VYAVTILLLFLNDKFNTIPNHVFMNNSRDKPYSNIYDYSHMQVISLNAAYSVMTCNAQDWLRFYATCGLLHTDLWSS